MRKTARAMKTIVTEETVCRTDLQINSYGSQTRVHLERGLIWRQYYYGYNVVRAGARVIRVNNSDI
jgi:hypothetical protein